MYELRIFTVIYSNSKGFSDYKCYNLSFIKKIQFCNMSFIFPTRNMSDKAALVKGHSLRFIGIHFFVFRELGLYLRDIHSLKDSQSYMRHLFTLQQQPEAKPLTIITKRSILDFAAVLDPLLTTSFSFHVTMYISLCFSIH